VAISEEALVASVELTDRYVTDRVRPDRAIDVLDEACAHTQATASYSRELESLILERRALVSASESARAAANEAVSEAEASNEPAEAGTPGAPGAPAGASGVEAEDDPLGRMARNGFAALERFGLELEAALSSGFARPAAGSAAEGGEGDAARRQRPAPGADAAGTRPREREPRPGGAPRRRERLAALEAELRRRLIEEGLVVRGHDVARVVAVSTGQHVHWSI